MIALLLAFVSLFFQPVFRPPEDQGVPAAVAHADCPLGCVVGPSDWVYKVTPEDVAWLAKVVKMESGPRFVDAESSATAWALIQGFALRKEKDPDGQTLAKYVRGYSAACSWKWSSDGTHYSPRITPRADRCRATGFSDLPPYWRDFAVDVLRGLYPNRVPGYFHVLARGFESSARDNLIGPVYATTEEQHPGGNAYYATAETRGWGYHTVYVLPAYLPHRAILAVAAVAMP